MRMAEEFPPKSRNILNWQAIRKMPPVCLRNGATGPPQALSPFSLTTRIERMHCKPCGLEGGGEAAGTPAQREVDIAATEARRGGKRRRESRKRHSKSFRASAAKSSWETSS